MRGRPGAPLCALILCIVLGAVGCSKKPPPIGNDLLTPLGQPTRWGPEPSDAAAALLAEAALADNEAHVEQALAEIEAAHDSHVTKGLGPLCQDLANTTLDDPIAYREASKRLVKNRNSDHALKARLEQSIKNDSLRLARRRQLDSFQVYWARTFNAVSEPLGTALLTGLVTAPFTLAQGGAHYLASFSNDEPLSVTGRQALVLHREYLEHHPDAKNADKVQRKIRTAERKFEKTLRKRREREAKAALKRGRPHLAALSAERALEHGDSKRAVKILETADAQIAAIDERQELSLQAAANPSVPIADEDALRLSVALLATDAGELRVSDLEKLGIDPTGAHADEYAFVKALAQLESGWEELGSEHMGAIAAHDPANDFMARHAQRLIEAQAEDPYRAFKRLQVSQSHKLMQFRMFGQWTRGTRYPNLPKALAYGIEAPAIAQTLVTMPLRLIFGSWNDHPDFDRPTAVAGYRYLADEPAGDHQREVLEWLVDYEEERGNAVAALRAADFLPYLDQDRRIELLEKAGDQGLTAATRSKRVDEQNSILRNVAREFPDTESGHEAGRMAREQALHHTAQQIRVTKSFLVENPRVAGEDGLGVRPELLNDEVKDGEIHPNGVTFLGGRKIKLAMIGESGDEDDEPIDVYKTVSNERLSRAAAMLDETSRLNELIDPDEALGNDGDRDRFIERARLGLSESENGRASAQSNYVYRSMRERYGMVRGRESMLPFDLVLQGNFTDLSLGAFPRWRPPKETPDAFLYK